MGFYLIVGLIFLFGAEIFFSDYVEGLISNGYLDIDYKEYKKQQSNFQNNRFPLSFMVVCLWPIFLIVWFLRSLRNE